MLIQKCPIVLKQRGCNTTVHSPAVRSSALFMGACEDFIYEKTYTRCTIAIHTKFKASSCTTVTVSSSVFQIQSHFSLTLGESSPAHTCIHTCTLLDDDKHVGSDFSICLSFRLPSAIASNSEGFSSVCVRRIVLSSSSPLLLLIVLILELHCRNISTFTLQSDIIISSDIMTQVPFCCPAAGDNMLENDRALKALSKYYL